MVGKTYQRYVLVVLTLVFTLNYTDRALFALLLQPIKEDLHLSDSQIGFLTGIAFALFYSTLGLPMARWADRGNRATIASLAIGLWGLTVMACLWTSSFLQLATARTAAAIGESGCMPPTYSLLGDYFPEPAARVRAMAIYWLANPLAGIIGFILGGVLNSRYGWRMTFLLLGIPGLLAAVLVKSTVAEPRKGSGADVAIKAAAPRMGEVLCRLWHQPSSRYLIVGITLFFTMALGLAPWYAAFMMRTHGMGTAELGLWLGLIFGVGGAVGTLAGGYVAARWFADDERGQLRLSAVIVVLLVPCSVTFLFQPHKLRALIALVPLIVALNFIVGPTFALLQRLVDERIRATTLAVVMLLGNLVGMGIGPQLIGLVSDYLRPSFGNDSLRYAMLALSSVALVAAHLFWRTGRTVKEDLQAVSARRVVSATVDRHPRVPLSSTEATSRSSS